MILRCVFRVLSAAAAGRCPVAFWSLRGVFLLGGRAASPPVPPRRCFSWFFWLRVVLGGGFFLPFFIDVWAFFLDVWALFLDI